jgi:hypothetical protein
MRPFRALLLFVPVVLVACTSSESSEPATDDADFTGSNAETKLTCEGGAAVLEVDRRVTKAHDLESGGEIAIREAQFVVRDRGVVDYLSSKVAHVQNAKGEIVVSGSLRDGQVFDFIEDRSFDGGTTRNDGNKVRIREQMVAVAHRVKDQEGRVRIVFNRRTERMTCSTYWEESHCAFDQQQNKPGTLSTERNDAPIADWVFGCTQ